MNQEKYDLFIKRAQALAEEHINNHVKGLGDEKLETVAKAIITTSALITAQLLAEYDDNKEKGNI
jgi:hypothetical protein